MFMPGPITSERAPCSTSLGGEARGLAIVKAPLSQECSLPPYSRFPSRSLVLLVAADEVNE